MMGLRRGGTAAALAGLLILGAAGAVAAETVVSRPTSLQNTGVAAGPIEEGTGRALSVRNLGTADAALTDAATRALTLRNLGLARVEVDAVARAVTVQNVDLPAGPLEAALARLLTLQNVGVPAAAPAEGLGRALTAKNFGVAAPPVEEATGRAFTARDLGVTGEPPIESGLTRVVTLQNLGATGEPPLDVAIGRAFTVQNAGDVVDVPRDSLDRRLPGAFALHAGTPNPFHAQTSIRFDLPRPSPVSLRIYDVSGRLVRVLFQSPQQEPGFYVAHWDGTDQAGRSLGSGTYFYRMIAGPQVFDRRVTLLRD